MAGHGAVLNIAVRPLVSVHIDVFARGSREAHVMLDIERFAHRYAPDLAAAGWGPHPLLEASLHTIAPPPDADIEVTIRSDAPAGASTGTSAAVVVALLGALDRLTGGQRTPADIAREAHAVETVRLGLQSGVQDQLSAAHGGVNFIEILGYPRAVATTLALAPAVYAALDERLALVYLGRPHRSSAVHEMVVRDLERAGAASAELQALRAAARDARAALLAGDLDALGDAMRVNTAAQGRLHPDLVQPDARQVIAIAAAHRAVGWKVNGAGGDGGSLTLLGSADGDERQAMERALVRANPACVRIPIAISRDGLRVGQRVLTET